MSVSAENRYNELKALLLEYSYQYYTVDKPTVSDAVYDSLMLELKGIEARYPDLITLDSPTQRIGNRPLEKFTKARHSRPMISLNDVFSKADIEAWVKRIDKLLPGNKHEFSAEIKMDGLACALIYEDGLLVRAVTRGDGQIGEDVTANVRTIKSIPLKLHKQVKSNQFLNGRTEIRGEIIMLKRDFSALNKERVKAGLPVFANPRNLAAGTIRQLDPKLVAERPLNFRAYDVLRDDPGEVPNYMFAYEIARALGFASNEQARLCQSINEVMRFIDEWENKREKLPFNTDGIAIKVNDRKLYDELGIVGKNPRGAVAYKYPAEQATTIIKDIVISIGRTGAATPVAVFDPVVVAGTTIRHASLHNADEIERKDVRIGDTVVVFKAGDIIPQVESVLVELRPKTAKKYNFEAELARQYPELGFIRPEGEAVYRVRDFSGPLNLKRALEHFASKPALDIDTLGKKNVEALVDGGLVNDIADIYNLSENQVVELERFADISAKNLVSAIRDSKNPSLERFIYGLGIRHVGQQTAVDLAERFGSIEKLADAGIDDLRSVSGVGEVVAESIIAWFSDKDNLGLLAKFAELGVEPRHEDKISGVLSGQSFAITGTLGSMSRDEAADRIRRLGGVFQTSVGKGTTYLVAAGKVGTSKLENARKFGTEIIDEARFLELL